VKKTTPILLSFCTMKGISLYHNIGIVNILFFYGKWRIQLAPVILLLCAHSLQFYAVNSGWS